MPQPSADLIHPDFQIAAASRAARTDVVYYVRFGDRIKIGTTSRLAERLREIPHDAVLGLERGGRDVERKRHAQFCHLRDFREWFRASQDLLDHIAMLPRLDDMEAAGQVDDAVAAAVEGLLVTASEAASLLGLMPRTIYQWRRRKHLNVRGLSESGHELYDLAEVTAVKTKPRRPVAT